MMKTMTKSPARWFFLSYYVLLHFVGEIFAFPFALMFMNYAVKKNHTLLKSKPISFNLREFWPGR